MHPTNKYEADGGPGVEDMVGALHAVTAADPTAAVGRLLSGVGFNWLILGTDAHAKNYSLLLSGAQVRLAPFYDLASAVVLGDHPKKLRLAQKVGGEYRPTVIGARHWVRLGDATGIGGERLLAEVRDLAARLADAMATVIAAEDLDGDAREFADRLLDGVATWSLECRASL